MLQCNITEGPALLPAEELDRVRRALLGVNDPADIRILLAYIAELEILLVEAAA